MKCLILAAGYATRLYPLTENFPKPLLEVGGRPILDILIDDIDKSGAVDEYIVISNHKFANCFYDWAKQKKYKITVVDDGTETNETRLGAVCDIEYAVEKLGIDSDALIIAGDNLLDFSLTEFISYADEKKTSCVMRYYEEDEKRLVKSGVAQVNSGDLIVSMEEKPQCPKSNWCCPPFYYYTSNDLKLIKEGIENGCGTDAPGSFIAWLCQRSPVHAMEMPGKRYDIGNLESYKKVNEEYKGIVKMTKRNVSLNNKTILVTGSAGFIGYFLTKRLLDELKGATIIGFDSVNDYYDVSLKEYRLRELEATKTENKYVFVKGNLADKALVAKVFDEYKPAVVVNLAAQAGVRYSIDHPDVYIESNIIGFYNILEACRHHEVEHLVYASSSSVYGGNTKVPFSTDDKVDTPISLYAATKKSNELLAHAYSKLYNIPSTGLRFFTVYGPAGRPDMAYFGFTNKLIKGETIEIFNYGNCKRDFTYIDDIVEGVVRVMERAPEKKNGADGLPIPPYRVYNIGNSNPENLLDFVEILSEELVRTNVLPADFDFEAHKKLVPMQPGDVPVTYADTSALEADTGFKPSTPLREGLRKFAEWYKEFYNPRKKV